MSLDELNALNSLTPEDHKNLKSLLSPELQAKISGHEERAKNSHRGAKVPKELIKAAKELYKKGLTQAQIAEKLEINIMTIGNHLRKMPDFEQYKKSINFNLYSRYKEIHELNLTSKQKAEMLNCSLQSIYKYKRILDERGE